MAARGAGASIGDLELEEINGALAAVGRHSSDELECDENVCQRK